MKLLLLHIICHRKGLTEKFFLVALVFLTGFTFRLSAQNNTVLAVSDSADTGTIFQIEKSNPAILTDTLFTQREKIKFAERLSELFGDTATEKALIYDRFLFKLAKKRKDTNLFRKYLEKYYKHQNRLCRFDKADSTLKAIKPLINGKRNPKDLANYYYETASNYYDWSRYKKSAEYYQKARSIYERLGDKPGIAKCLKAEGAIWANFSDFERAIGLLQRARDIYNSIGDQGGLAALNNTLGVVMQSWGKYNRALEYFTSSLNYYKQKKDLWNQLNQHLHISDVYRYKKEYSKALKELKTAEQLSRNVNHKKLQSIIYSNLGELFYDIHNYDSALRYQQMALPLKYEVGDRRRIAISLLDLMKIYLRKGEIREALKYGEKAARYASMINANDLRLDIYKYMSDIYYNMGNYKQAYEYLKKYNKLHKIVFDRQSQKLLSEMEVKYEAAKKDKENALLKKANAMNKLALSKEKETRLYLIVITSFILFIALVLIFFIQYKNKLNRQNTAVLTAKNKKISEKSDELEKANRELLISRERYRSIVENATIGMYQTTPDGRILFANKTLLSMLGYSDEDLKKINLNKEKPGRKDFIKLLEEQQIITGREDVWKRADGSEMWVNESAWIIREENGNVLYYEGIVEDITKRKIAEKEAENSRKKLEQINKELRKKNIEIEKARKEAESANKAKSDFLANISHEIRTPLNSIIGFTELLQKSLTDPQSSGYIQSIMVSSNSLLSLINDILDLSKIQAGKLELSYEPVFICKLLDEISQIFYALVEQKGLEFKIESSIPKDLRLFLDYARVRQILFNIIGNAIKFTEKGSVTLIAESVACNEQKNKYNLLFTVKDTGIGIPEEEIETIFQPFEQSKQTKSKRNLGTGLGLSITKKLLEIMGGSISVKSNHGKGSVFSINILCIKAAGSLESLKKGIPEKPRATETRLDTGLSKIKEPVADKMNKAQKELFIRNFSEAISREKNNHVISEITALSKKIEQFAKKEGLNNLESHSKQIARAAHQFDIEAMEYYLNLLTKYYTFEK